MVVWTSSHCCLEGLKSALKPAARLEDHEEHAQLGANRLEHTSVEKWSFKMQIRSKSFELAEEKKFIFLQKQQINK